MRKVCVNQMTETTRKTEKFIFRFTKQPRRVAAFCVSPRICNYGRPKMDPMAIKLEWQAYNGLTCAQAKRRIRSVNRANREIPVLMRNSSHSFSCRRWFVYRLTLCEMQAHAHERRMCVSMLEGMIRCVQKCNLNPQNVNICFLASPHWTTSYTCNDAHDS